MIDFSKFNSLVDIAINFNTNEKCKAAIAESRWGDDVVCPYCGHHHCNRRKDGRYVCSRCNHNFSELVGTVFENTKINLVKWFMAMYLISSHKKGISSHQLARDIHTTQKTAWYILHKIRSLYRQDYICSLAGDIQCDELYLGGREKNKHESKKTANNRGKSLKTKSAIFGMADGDGNAVAFVVPDTKAKTLHPIICKYVAKHSNIFTDENKSYLGLEKKGYNHYFVCHSALEFVNGGVTTNTIEGFWGHFKRMVFGTYHYVSPKYLQRYVDESIYRWNTREFGSDERFISLFDASIGVFDYRAVKMAA